MALLIPNKIKVGVQKRDDTYTGKLAYIIYYNKNKLCKEVSRKGWMKEDLGDFENKPIEGFVLNKKVGGYSTGWNHRNTYSRVYDPRGFEFEINMENLLFILENTNSIKGKGLEGEFVYAWNSGDLVLLPTSAPDYEQIKDFSEKLQGNKKITAKQLILGHKYRNKSNQEVIFLGSRIEYNQVKRYVKKEDKIWKYSAEALKPKKVFIFIPSDGKRVIWKRYNGDLIVKSSVSGYLLEDLGEVDVSMYYESLENLDYNIDFNEIDIQKEIPLPEEIYGFVLDRAINDRYSNTYSIEDDSNSRWAYRRGDISLEQLKEIVKDYTINYIRLKNGNELYDFVSYNDLITNFK